MSKLNVTLLAVLALSATSWGADGSDIVKASGVKGGLIVHVGCGDGELTARLRINKRFIVQGLDAEPGKIAEARRLLARNGRTGPVSVSTFDGKHLPYADSMVNLLVCESAVPRREMLRVLAPRGAALLRSPLEGSEPAAGLEGWRIYRKPCPETIDDWTHYLHSPGNNAVAKDTVVGPPQHIQWIASPRFARSHDHLASVSAMVSSKGRVFSIVDEGSVAFAAAAPRWKLVARDAFNGIRLWDAPITKWENHLRDFRSGPADIARRLAAVGDAVYVTLGYGEPVVSLDAATGKTLKKYEGTAGTREILCCDDTLFLVLGKPHKAWGAAKAKEIVKQKDYHPPFEKLTPPGHAIRVASISARTGQVNWVNKESYTRDMMPATLTVSGGRVFFHTLTELICLNAKDGKQLWKASRPIERQRLAWSSPTVVACEGIVYAADRANVKTEGDLQWLPSGGFHEYIRGRNVGGKLIAYDAGSGKQLWSCPAWEGFNSAVDIFIADGLLWTGRYAWGSDPGITEGRDPKTGQVKRTRPSDKEVLGRIGHARCHRAKATSNYLIVGRRGIDMVDVKSGKLTANFWVRGNCAYGIMPANGLIYAPPHSCACSVDGLLKSGFMALAPQRQIPEADDSTRLIKGPAFGSASEPVSAAKTSEPWPTYRRDNARLGGTKTNVSPEPKKVWSVKIAGELTPAVVAGGVLLVASKERHTVHARDAESGKELWTFTAGARIDSPPSIFPTESGKGLSRCIFGCRDGYVYCLRLTDGQLAWKFRAAPRQRRIVVDGQLESTWPVPGNVLVAGGKAYFAAGRTSFLDNGMILYELDAATGKVLKTQPLQADKKNRDSGGTGGHLPDVLASDGKHLYMRGASFDSDLVRQKRTRTPHLWSSVGFLDENWWHRTYWQFGATMGSGWGGWSRQAQSAPVGRLLVADGRQIYGYGRDNHDNSGGHVGIDGRHSWGPIRSPLTAYRLFGSDLTAKRGAKRWTRRISVLGQAMLLTPKALFVAGPQDPARNVPHDPWETDPIVRAIESTSGGKLMAVSPQDGKTIAECELSSPPVFDGMIAADGRIYLSTKAGEVICLK